MVKTYIRRGGITIALKKQIHIYSVDTSCFYNKTEKKIHDKLNQNYIFIKKLNKVLLKLKKSDKEIDIIKAERFERYISNSNKRIKKLKSQLYREFKKNNAIRHLDESCLTKNRIISVFDSALTRTLGMEQDQLYDDIIIVQTYFFDVIEDIILDGFMYNGEKYVCFTASAGQIRTKKTVFIKESVLLKHQNTLMCGLTVDEINRLGGVNINKYLAYLALCNSATDVWEEFDIDKSIVVDDMETVVTGIVDFIDDKTYEITRKQMDILINHTDGCGMYLPKVNNKNMMIRLPWVKGLLVSFPYDKFIQKVNGNSEGKYYGKIKDIYGKEWDILKDNIQIIFTKSQFKMWKYYPNEYDENGNVIKYGWDKYKENFKKYNCQAGKCNEEEDVFNNAKINYQMLQTLTDMTNDELEVICKTTKYNITNVGRDRRTMLKVLGVTKANTNKNYYQQALEIYPELLSDTYSKEILKSVKKSMVKEGRAGKIDINGVYTFISPDLYAFCEYLFLGEKEPRGLLKDGEVYCKLYKNVEKLDCLRSPHLYREHAVRKNVVDKEKSEWFITNALYTSCHDLISKILMFDNDGDKSLVCAEPIIIQVAERNMKDIVPLYYNMRKAEAEIITNQSIYNGLKTAYTGGNIGMISNDITKIWNSDNVNLDVIKLLCMENNFTIDYAKTLYKPERPKKIKTLINNYTKYKTPHFFIYAKDKTKDKVEEINNSVVNRLNKFIPNPKINFSAINLGKFNYKMLMKNKDVELDEKIIEKYKELDLRKRFIEVVSIDEDDTTNDSLYLYKDIRKQLLEINFDINYVVDVLVKYLYEYKKSNYKTTLWSSFGDVIVENLRNNIKINNTYCDNCGVLIKKANNKIKYCKSCAREIHKEVKRASWHKNKGKYKSTRQIENPIKS